MKRYFQLMGMLIFCVALTAQEDRHSTTMQDAWLSCTATANPNTARGTGHWILYDFKDMYALEKSTFWNFNTPTRLNHYRNMSWSLNLLQGSLEDGLKDIFIDISLDGVTWQEWGRFTLPKANGSGFYEGSAGPDFNGKIARYVLITARNNYGGTCYGLSEVRFNATPATVSDTENEEVTAGFISISPNPAKDMVQVGLESLPEGLARYTVLDMQGKIMTTGEWTIRQNWGKEYLSVNDLPTGAYILTLTGKEYSRNVKFEVVK